MRCANNKLHIAISDTLLKCLLKAIFKMQNKLHENTMIENSIKMITIVDILILFIRWFFGFLIFHSWIYKEEKVIHNL